MKVVQAQPKNVVQCPDCGLWLQPRGRSTKVPWHDPCGVSEEVEGLEERVARQVAQIASQESVPIGDAQNALLKMLLAKSVGNSTMGACANAVTALAELKESEGEGSADAADLMRAIIGNTDGT